MIAEELKCLIAAAALAILAIFVSHISSDEDAKPKQKLDGDHETVKDDQQKHQFTPGADWGARLPLNGFERYR